VDVPRETVGEVLVVSPQHEYVDASNSQQFKDDLAAVIGDRNMIVVDLSRIQFIDSAGCGAFISLLKQVKARGGEVKLCGLTRPVRTLFELVRMHRIFDIFNTRDEALKAFQV
jgi:anti-sigma B factor antagonist